MSPVLIETWKFMLLSCADRDVDIYVIVILKQWPPEISLTRYNAEKKKKRVT